VLGFFRTNQLAANLLLIIYVIVLYIAGLLATSTWESSEGGVLTQVIHHYVGTQGMLPKIFTIILVLLQALLLNILAARFRISEEVTMYPGVFYLLLMSTLPDFQNLSPVLIGNTFLILAVSSLFNSYKKTSTANSIFNVGFWVGMASLCYFSNFVFVLLAIFGLSTIRNLRINELFMILIGVLVPLFLAGTIAFWNDALESFYQITFINQFGVLDFAIDTHWKNYVPLILFGLLTLISFLSLNTYFQKQGIRSQKNIQVLYYFIIIAILSIFLQKEITVNRLQLLAIPLALLLPLNFLSFKRKEIGNGIHLTWLIGVLFLQYRLLFM